MENYTVYLHQFPNGKKYVGITCQDVNRRWRKGEAYKQNPRLYRAFKKYGWDNVEHIILHTGLTEQQACEKEIELISKWHLQDESKGYNLASGGKHSKHSEETKKKIGEKSKGRTHSEDFKKWISAKNSGSNNYMYGKCHTEETKLKISESKKGKPSPNKGKFGGQNPHAKKVVAINAASGEEIACFNSIVEAAELTRRSKSGISACLNGKQQTSGGYRWRYA